MKDKSSGHGSSTQLVLVGQSHPEQRRICTLSCWQFGGMNTLLVIYGLGDVAVCEGVLKFNERRAPTNQQSIVIMHWVGSDWGP